MDENWTLSMVGFGMSGVDPSGSTSTEIIHYGE
jgi:hypothetical protein